MTSVGHIRQKTGSSDEVYIGRPGKGLSGIFGNPVVIGKVCPECSALHVTAGDTLPCFKKYFESRLGNDLTFTHAVLALKGKRLLCFCKTLKNPNAPCHGDVIKSWLDSLVE